MSLNSIFIVISEHEQQSFNISKFFFRGLKSYTLTEFKADDKQNLLHWVKLLTTDDLVVTIGNWSENPQLFALVSIARQLQIPVIHESNFQKYVEQHNN